MKKNSIYSLIRQCIDNYQQILRKMKITILLIILTLTQVHATVHSQAVIAEMNFQEATLKDAFAKIESETGFKILYRADLIDMNQLTSVKVKNVTITELLGKLLFKTEIDYKIVNTNLIVLTPKFTLKVAGKVISAKDGQPIPGVSVVEKGTSNGTITDFDGNYSLIVESETATLVFSYIGYKSIELPVNGKTSMDVTLDEKDENIDEVVVIGYGTQKIGNVTGSVAKISGKDISSLPLVSIDQAMQGKVSGVSVINNGSPGSSPIVQIRGVGSINFSSTPLYVVDGIPTSSINNINSADIESLDVLKDASATAIYGSRGSNGVIIITTKKGNSKKFTVQYDGYAGAQKASKQLDLLKRDDYIKYATDLMNNAGHPLPERIDPATGRMNELIWTDPTGELSTTQTYATTETDWQDAMFRTAGIQQHTLSLSGGNEKSKFYTSAGYFKQDGIMVGTSYSRLNFRLNSNHEINKYVSFGETFSLSNDKNQLEGSTEDRPLLMHMERAIPYNPIYNPTFDGGFQGPTAYDGSDYQNPVLVATIDDNYYKAFKLIGTAFAEIKFADWLKFKSTVGLDYGNDMNFGFYHSWNDGYRASAPGASDYRATYTSWIFTNQLSFIKEINKHYINATLVAEKQSSNSYNLSGAGSLPDNNIQQMVGLSGQQTSGSKYEDVLLSYIGRVQYSFANKYLFSASIRADGSSKFAAGHKWGYFNSFSAGWNIKEEAFLKDVKAISDMKLRISYGETGFNGIGNYVWQSSMNIGNANYPYIGSTQGASMITRLGNPDLQWETTKMTNYGIDFKFLDNALSFTAEYYDRHTSKMILNIVPNPSFGYADATPTNIGEMSNKGFEFQVGYNKQVGQLGFNISANLATNKNEVLKLDLPTTKLWGNSNQDFGNYPITLTQEGMPVQQFYGFRVDHILQEGEAHPTMPNAQPGDIIFKDLDGSGTITDDDREVLGNYLPKFIYGLNFSINFKGFDFTVFLQGTQGNKIYNANRITTEGMQRLFNSDVAVLNAWTPTNTNTDMPRAVDSDPNNNARISDRWLEDGSYMRLKTLTLGYTVPSSVMNSFAKGVISNLRLYFSAQNLLTVTSYKGYDPEIGRRASSWNAYQLNQGVDYGMYPQPRTFLGGLQISF